jgi:DNA replication protein DnaC
VREVLKSDNNIYIHTSTLTTYQELVEKISVKVEGENVSMAHKTSQLLDDYFKKDYHVFLLGDISVMLLQYLMPILMQQKRMTISGDLENLSANLYLLLPLASQLNLASFQVNVINTIPSVQSFKEDERKIAEKIIYIFNVLKKIPRGLSSPSIPFLSQRRLKLMVESIKAGINNNPLKPFFLYGYSKDSEEYSFINMLCKISLFDDKQEKIFNQLKFEKIIKKIESCGLDSFDFQWEIFNALPISFTYAFLQSFDFNQVNDTCSLPKFIDRREVWHRFFKEKMKDLTPSDFSIKNESEHLDKPRRKLNEFLKSDERMVILKGVFGVGKTYLIREIVASGYVLFDGEESIVKFLKSKPSETNVSILFLDEANLMPDGYYDFLIGLFFNKVYYKGFFYDTNNYHKVIFTGNPETYPGRNFHYVINEYAKTIWMKRPTDQFILDQFNKILGDSSLSSSCVTIFKIASDLYEYHDLSLRDVESFAWRVRQEQKNKSSLYHSAMIEYYYTYADKSMADKFKEAILSQLNPQSDVNKKYEVQQLGSIWLPSSFGLFYDTIKNDIDLIESCKDEKIKKAILIEGAPGMGKSSLFIAILNEKRLPFTHIYAGTPDAKQILREAFKNGHSVLIDELNLDPELEQLLNHFLTGKDENGQEPESKGFTVYATQNLVTEKGRKIQSLAFTNRFHYLHLPTYEKADKLEIATAMNISDPETFVAASMNEGLNMRDWNKLKDRLETTDASETLS